MCRHSRLRVKVRAGLFNLGWAQKCLWLQIFSSEAMPFKNSSFTALYERMLSPLGTNAIATSINCVHYFASLSKMQKSYLFSELLSTLRVICIIVFRLVTLSPVILGTLITKQILKYHMEKTIFSKPDFIASSKFTSATCVCGKRTLPF